MTPAIVKASIVTPDELRFICSVPFISNDNVFAVAAEKPVLVLPVNLIDGLAAEPAGIINVPVIVSPALSTFNDAAPVKLAVIVPAEKLPDPSRDTMAFAVFALVAVVAELATFPAVLIVASFVSTIPAAGSTSALIINELDNKPDELLWTIPAVLNGVMVSELLIT